MSRLKDMAIVLSCTWLAGCTQTLHLSAPGRSPVLTSPQSTEASPTPPAAGPQVNLWVNHFLWGFVGRKTVDVRDFCPGSHVSEIALSYDAWTVLAWTVTVGMYSPRRLLIVCSPEETTP